MAAIIATVWTEIKPILGPLIQAGVVLLVGRYTLLYQRRQVTTAEQKLTLDLHDKRYKALTSFTEELWEEVLAVLYESDEGKAPFLHLPEAQRRSRSHYWKLQELSWLFADDVMFYVTKLHEHHEAILGIVNRLRHELQEDNATEMTADLNWHNDSFNYALTRVNEVARDYLFVGTIKGKAEPAHAFSLDELEARKRPDTY